MSVPDPNIRCPRCNSTDVECQRDPHVHLCHVCGFDGQTTAAERERVLQERQRDALRVIDGLLVDCEENHVGLVDVRQIRYLCRVLEGSTDEVWQDEIDTLRGSCQFLEATITEALVIHQPVRGELDTYCKCCGGSYPCPTVRVLGGGDSEPGDET